MTKTCNDCIRSQPFHPIENNPFAVLNVYCSLNDTVEPVQSWVIRNNIERLKLIPALKQCFKSKVRRKK